MVLSKCLGVTVRPILCPFFGYSQVFSWPPRRGVRGRLSPLTGWFGAGRGKLLPDEGRLLGKCNLCPFSRQQSPWARKDPVSLTLAY